MEWSAEHDARVRLEGERMSTERTDRTSGVNFDEVTRLVDALEQDLNLTGAQIEKMHLIFERFEEKQSLVPLPGQVLLDNKDMLRDVLTSKEFDRQKAEQLVKKVTAIIQMATVNRLELRHDLYQQLTPDQQQQYMDMVQAKVAELLQ